MYISDLSQQWIRAIMRLIPSDHSGTLTQHQPKPSPFRITTRNEPRYTKTTTFSCASRNRGSSSLQQDGINPQSHPKTVKGRNHNISRSNPAPAASVQARPRYRCCQTSEVALNDAVTVVF